MKRFTAIFAMLMLLSLPAKAVSFRFTSPAYPGLYGREITVTYERVRSGPDGELVLLDENGQELGSARVSAAKKSGGIRVGIDTSMPLGQEMQLVFRCPGAPDEVQDTALLAADDVKHDGIRKVDTEKKQIAITFDTASGMGRTEKLAALLEKHGVHCTFFIEGEFALSSPELVQLLDAGGHEVANHSMHHPEMMEIENHQIYQEITKCNAVLEEITGKPVTLYRPPSGYYTWRDRTIGRGLGCEMILWTFDSLDGFADSTEDKVWKVMTEKSENGAIILMHVYGKHTLNILDRYIPFMREQGYEFVTVSELLGLSQP